MKKLLFLIACGIATMSCDELEDLANLNIPADNSYTYSVVASEINSSENLSVSKSATIDIGSFTSQAEDKIKGITLSKLHYELANYTGTPVDFEVFISTKVGDTETAVFSFESQIVNQEMLLYEEGNTDAVITNASVLNGLVAEFNKKEPFDVIVEFKADGEVGSDFDNIFTWELIFEVGP